MTGSRLALVAEDAQLAATVQESLKSTLSQPAFQCKYDTIRQHLGRDTDGVLVLVVTSTHETELALRLIQELSIQKLPMTVVVLAPEALPACKEMRLAESQGAFVIRWPFDEDRFHLIAAEYTTRANCFLGTREETLDEIISRRLLSMTPSLMPMVERIGLAAMHDVTVLLTGETGTGKTFLARLMHDCSERKHHPFLAVPCGAQPANLVESAFFGHAKGAFTGADRAKIGKFAAAGNGSILLDEIDTLGLEQQAGLLRVIETGEYEPVGSNETQICSARIIVASNWDLEEAARQGKFRQDLYYRLNVMSFHLPPLRERRKDIGPLVRGMAARFCTKFRKELFDISPGAMSLLEAFPWPGNIRQMENAVQQAVLVSNGPELLSEHLPQPIRDHTPVAETNGHHKQADDSLKQSIDTVERNLIMKTLEKHGNSRARAAQALNISRVTLYKKMKRYDLMPEHMRRGQPPR
jgi:two-component system response regulator HydG